MLLSFLNPEGIGVDKVFIQGQDIPLGNAKTAQSYLPELNKPQRVESKLTIHLKVTELL